jgi:hypothetical protein
MKGVIYSSERLNSLSFTPAEYPVSYISPLIFILILTIHLIKKIKVMKKLNII